MSNASVQERAGNAKNSGGAGDPIVYMIGNAHIDPVWLWQWQDGFAEVKATFRAALDRIDEFPDFVFTSACAAYYQWVEENAPDMFGEIRRRVAEGRFAFTGGFWIQPDCNIPSGESFCRHALYSQRYFYEKFGRAADVGYNVDSFGHNGMLPQIYKKSGIDSYVFMRPDEKEKGIAEDLFNWHSPDGSSVLASRIYLSYGEWIQPGDLAEYKDVPATVAKILVTKKRAASAPNAAIAARAQAQELPLMCFFGVGNHGGGPTIAALRAIEAYRAGKFGRQADGADGRVAENAGGAVGGGAGNKAAESVGGAAYSSGAGDAAGSVTGYAARAGGIACGAGNVVYASPSEYFGYLRRSGIAGAAPAVSEDLQHHASGCYSANSAIKMLNRKAENRLLTAEKLMSAAHALAGHGYDRDLLNRAWRKLMFNQFHDILAGCSIKAACQDAIEFFGESVGIASELANAALQKISWHVDTSGGARPVRSKESDWMLWERDGGASGDSGDASGDSGGASGSSGDGSSGVSGASASKGSALGAPLVAFNPHSFPVTAPICVNKELRGVADRDGAPIPAQLVRGGQTNLDDLCNTLFMAELPPLGYSLFWIYRRRELGARVPDGTAARAFFEAAADVGGECGEYG
ncbi:MAG: hypothetical protein LBJ10_09800, partial [Clostridiales bacterium]|nr:hypothetical protein [Clostridiales bacterium]